MTELSQPTPDACVVSNHRERLRSYCRQHWLGLDASADRKLAADVTRHGYFTAAVEHFKAATRMYELLTTPESRSGATQPAFVQVPRNIQLLLAYSTLWEAFRFTYSAAAYTSFALGEEESAPVEDERAKIDRVLRTPILPESEIVGITMLRNGETPVGAVERLCGRHSRELEQITGETHDLTMTDMDAFMQGAVAVQDHGAARQTTDRPWESWCVRALDDAGKPIDPHSPFDAAKYRSAIKWLCYQIRLNVNFVGKSDDSLDDMILVIRAFCLLEPIVGILLKDSRKDAIFALTK